MLKLALLFLGLVTLIGLVWHIGPTRIWVATSGLGAGALLVVLLPSLLMYLFDAYGWRITLGQHARKISFPRLLAIRTAGEVVNMTTPTAYMGGEPLKAYLLQRLGIPLVEGLASVVTAKTIMTIAQILFVVVGIGLAVTILGGATSSQYLGLAAAASIALLTFGTIVFFFIQRKGLFTSLLKALRWLRLPVKYLERHEDHLSKLDRSIVEFYTKNRSGFLRATLVFFLGWLAEAFEVYVMLYYLGGPVDLWTSIAIGALSVFIKGGTFFIPGSIGAQEVGNLTLLLAFGYSDVTGVTFALLRRVRELAWILIGLACLVAMGGLSLKKEASAPSEESM